MMSGGPERHLMARDNGEGIQRFNEYNGYFEPHEQCQDELSLDIFPVRSVFLSSNLLFPLAPVGLLWDVNSGQVEQNREEMISCLG